MSNDENKIGEYVYLNDKIAIEREDVLKMFVQNRIVTKDMGFYDLDFYLSNEKPYQKIRTIFNKSLYEPGITLLDAQMEILNILEENSLFLSAPTSFGKTFIVLEYMLRHPNLKNIVFIVPTLALMNELLKKIYDKFSDNYNICINGDEQLNDKNIFIFVPERSDFNFVDKIEKLGFDLLIIDEIYKLKLGSKKHNKTDDRIIPMNKVYLNLINKAKKIILLGPFINKVSFDNTKINIVKYYTNLLPVYNHVNLCPDAKYIDFMGGDKELVYFSSPRKIYKALDEIIAKFSENDFYIRKYDEEIKYLERNIYSEWYVIKLLKRGIGIHHGKTPMFLRKFYEDEFKNGSLKCLLCTDTLMEGINTPTMKLLVVDDPGSVFSLNNLIGRVGRLNVSNPKSGEIYIFNSSACKKYNNRNQWDSLQIMAEDKNVQSNDEILFLNKKCNDPDRLKDYDMKLNTILNNSGKTKEELSKYDIRMDLAYNFIVGDYKTKLIQAEDIRECVEISCKLLERKGYSFQKKDFDNLQYPYDNLPCYIFITRMIIGLSINEIIVDFEMKYGKLTIFNRNMLIDKLLDLRSFIKFKLSKISNYINLFNVDISKNKYLQMFVLNLNSYNDMKLSNKIFEDLGIEARDYEKLSVFVPEDENISTSKVINYLSKNKEKINGLDVSPFTKRSINKM